MFVVARLSESPVTQGGVALHPVTDHLNKECLSIQSSRYHRIRHLDQLQVYRSRFFRRPEINCFPELFDLKEED